jgi:hypothetical protein
VESAIEANTFPRRSLTPEPAAGNELADSVGAVLGAGRRAQDGRGDSGSLRSRSGSIPVGLSGFSRRGRLGIPASRSARRMISSSARSVRRRGVTGHRRWARRWLPEQHCWFLGTPLGRATSRPLEAGWGAIGLVAAGRQAAVVGGASAAFPNQN